MTKTRQVGLFAGTYNFPLDAIKVHAEVDFKTRFIRDIKYPITRLMDLLLLSNPEFDEEQITAFHGICRRWGNSHHLSLNR